MEMRDIDINEIEARENSRLENENITSLAESMKIYGLLQPIVLHEMKQSSNGYKYELVCGFRRFAAAKKLNWTKIPAKIEQNLNGDDILLRNLIENIQREDITAVEKGLYYYRLIKEFNFSVDDISNKLKIKKSSIETAITLYKYVPKEYRDKVRFISPQERNYKNVIPTRLAKIILKCSNQYRLSVDATSKLFDIVLTKKIAPKNIEFIAHFLKQDFDIDDSILMINEYEFVGMKIAIKKNELENAMKKYNIKSRNKLIKKILCGDLKITLNILDFKKNDGDKINGIYKEI